MRNLLVAAAMAALPSLLAPSPAWADGCFICQGQPNTYVKYKGQDTWDKRHKAEACGCKVGGTTSSCGATNHKVLCTVALAPSGEGGARPASAR